MSNIVEGTQEGIKINTLRADTNGMSDFPISTHNGRPCFRSYYFDTYGVRRQVRRSFDTERLAIEGYLKFAEQRDSGALLDNRKMSVADAVDWWLEILKDEGCKPTTLGGHRALMDLYVIPVIGKLPLSKLNPEHIRMVYRAMVLKGLATSSIQAVSRKLRAMLNQAVTAKKIPENVAKLVKPLKGKPKKKQIVYTPQQTQALAAALGVDRLAALWCLAANTGARRGELAGLRWSDLDFNLSLITFQNTRTLAAGIGVVEGDTKTDAGHRTIRPPEVVFDLLRDWKVRQTTERVALRGLWNGGDYVFTTRDGNPYRPGSISERLRILTERAGLPPIRTHALRHSLITNALRSRVDTAIVAPYVGHSNPRITADYQHVDPDIAYDQMTPVFDSFK